MPFYIFQNFSWKFFLGGGIAPPPNQLWGGSAPFAPPPEYASAPTHPYKYSGGGAKNNITYAC